MYGKRLPISRIEMFDWKREGQNAPGRILPPHPDEEDDDREDLVEDLVDLYHGNKDKDLFDDDWGPTEEEDWEWNKLLGEEHYDMGSAEEVASMGGYAMPPTAHHEQRKQREMSRDEFAEQPGVEVMTPREEYRRRKLSIKAQSKAHREAAKNIAKIRRDNQNRHETSTD